MTTTSHPARRAAAGLALVVTAGGLAALGASPAGAVDTTPIGCEPFEGALRCTYGDDLADFTRVGRFTVPTGVEHLQVSLQGGGGGFGFAANAANAGSPGSAGHLEDVDLTVAPGDALDVYLGDAGGNATACLGPNSGGTAGTSGGAATGIAGGKGGDGAVVGIGSLDRCAGGGGGGGSFVVTADESPATAVPRIAAGGGGGSGGARSTTTAGASYQGGSGGAGGPNDFPGSDHLSDDGNAIDGGLAGDSTRVVGAVVVRGAGGAGAGNGLRGSGGAGALGGGGGGGGGYYGGGGGGAQSGGGGGCGRPTGDGCDPAPAPPPMPTVASRFHETAVGLPGSSTVVYTPSVVSAPNAPNTPAGAPPVAPPTSGRRAGSNDPNPNTNPEGADREARALPGMDPATTTALCRPSKSCTVAPPPGPDSGFRIDADGGSQRATLFATTNGNYRPASYEAGKPPQGRPDCPGYRERNSDWVQFGFVDADDGASWRKTAVMTQRQRMKKAAAATLARELQICFAAPYAFPTRAGYRLGTSGPDRIGVLPDCPSTTRVRTAVGRPSACVATREVVAVEGGWVVRFTFKVPASDKDPKALG